MSSAEGESGKPVGQGAAVVQAAPRTLADLAPGARAEVAAVIADGVPEVARRLGDLGFTPGTPVEVVCRAPLRDPVIYRVRDYEVCLRREQAVSVHVVEETVVEETGAGETGAEEKR
ncbi:FeoA family protein [Streptomyces sp. NPDC026672]|uniref:FeoA family protein n=1 Tax=unclassified Streptomyces TaxID=2593676 RepID=UPI0033FBA6EF